MNAELRARTEELQGAVERLGSLLQETSSRMDRAGSAFNCAVDLGALAARLAEQQGCVNAEHKIASQMKPPAQGLAPGSNQSTGENQ